MQGWESRKLTVSGCVRLGIKLLKNEMIATTTYLEVVLLNIYNNLSNALISKKYLTLTNMY